MRLAVVGGGWAGLAASVRATEAGHHVTLFEMGPQLGGRARGVPVDGLTLDNGQHILIGAYQRTLALMRTVGSDVDATLARLPLELRYPDGRGLRVPRGPAWLGFVRAIATARGWNWHDRVSLAIAAAGWIQRGFRCDASLSVAALCARVPRAVRELLIDPLCVAALNTTPDEASAVVWLRVLRDALFGGPGSCDLLLPRRPLSDLLPGPAQTWLASRGARLRLGHRVDRLQRVGDGWDVEGDLFDAAVLACTAAEAARLARPFDEDWSRRAAALLYEPIVTVYLHAPGARLPAPMMALPPGPSSPAQFAFDLGALGGPPGVFAFVISGARPWVERGLVATASAVQSQATTQFAAESWPARPAVLRVIGEKRATFRCTPGLVRPATRIVPRLVAAGDYVEGPYPATLEGAVRSADLAVAALGG
jgi:squalene-associated FAD-dependent desaturase